MPNERFSPPKEFSARAHIQSHAEYTSRYELSLHDPDTFWREETQELVFRTPWSAFSEWNLPHAKFFVGATLNVSESCLDRHLITEARTRAAIVWEGEPGESRTLTYFDLHREAVRLSAALLDLGVVPGDRVAIYMGMVPETAIAMLACVRIGAVHSVVFGAFSSDALRDRIDDCGAKVLLTQDGAWRRGRVVPLKAMADAALANTSTVEKVVVFRRMGAELAPVTMTPGRDTYWDELLARTPEASSLAKAKTPTAFDAEHPLFILYTSGSTGKPKGVLHTSAGYLASVHVSCKYVFDLRAGDVYWCTADVGWITGHSYFVYGPLSNGASCLMYEGAPNTPDWGRTWEIIEKHGVTVFYTAPTAIRAFIRAGDTWPEQKNLTSLRLLGSVGEPISSEAWLWYHRVVGRSVCPIVDTWWQTETGSIMLTTLPGACSAKPGIAGLPMFGVDVGIIDERNTECGVNESGKLVLRSPWPSMARTLWRDDARYQQAYFSQAPGMYLTGDGARRDADGYIQVLGRIDDVLNIAGHRIGTAEIESALGSHPAVTEAAAVGRPDELKGQVLVVFVTLRAGHAASEELKSALAHHIDHEIGRFARPDTIRFTGALPKTRSGKIMRRLLKEIAAGTAVGALRGDTSTLEDFSVLASLEADEP